MSGGSWNYVYQQFEDASERLSTSDNPHRRALGDLVARIAPAMRAIEWVDSGDSAPGDETAPILEAVGAAAVIETAVAALRSEIERASTVLRSYPLAVDLEVGGAAAAVPPPPPIVIPPERWALFPDGGTLFVHRPQVKKGDRFRFSELAMLNVEPGGEVVVLTEDEAKIAIPQLEAHRRQSPPSSPEGTES